MKKSPAIVTSALSFLFALFAFAYWLPARIEQRAAAVFPDPAATAGKLPDAKALPPELLEYVKEERLAANSESDAADYDELLRRFEEFEREEREAASPEASDDVDADPLEQRFDRYALREEEIGNPEFFTVPEGLRDTVNFWRHVFGVYDKNQVVFYNQDDVGIVYSVLDFSDLRQMSPGSADAIQYQTVREEAQRLRTLLEKVAPLAANAEADAAGLSPEEQRLVALLRKNAGHVPSDAASLKASFAYRNGFAHRMKQAIAASGKYMPEMQRIFEEHGLPGELTVIPFVESSFNLNAYSSAGAAGVWQFIEATGKAYLRIDSVTDERYDPILATYAAASHLGKEYRLFRNWPLTINGYNTGPGRMLQAVRQLKTDRIETIVKNFKGAGYGFDSRNYYPEFLAALEVYRNRTRYFGDIPEVPEEVYDYVKMPADVNVRDLIRVAGLNEMALRDLNVALKPGVLSGEKKLPKGYLLKIPPEERDNVALALDELGRDTLYASYHVLEKGESLKDVAEKYGFTVNELVFENDLLPGERLKPGAILKLPEPDEDEAVSAVMPLGEEVIGPDEP